MSSCVMLCDVYLCLPTCVFIWFFRNFCITSIQHVLAVMITNPRTIVVLFVIIIIYLFFIFFFFLREVIIVAFFFFCLFA